MNTTAAMPQKRTPTSTRLPTYLAGAAGTAAFLMAPQAEAAVTAVTFGFGTELTAADGFASLTTVDPDFGFFLARSNPYQVFLGAGGGLFYHNSSLSSDYGLATFFTTGTVIGAGGNGANGIASWSFYSASYPAYNSLLSFGSDQLDKNIAFLTSTGNWGWANVSWTESTKTLAINSAYVESVAGDPITVGNVGAVPEPSRTLLALAGLGGVALRRRRRQAVCD